MKVITEAITEGISERKNDREKQKPSKPKKTAADAKVKEEGEVVVVEVEKSED